MNDVSTFRLYSLRALYLLVVVGLAIVLWPKLIHHDVAWAPMEGVVNCMLASFSLLSLAGLRYPLKMLPILFWELLWKSLWLLLVGYPMWSAGTLDEAHQAIGVAVLGVVIFPFVIPWRYVYANYCVLHGDRWK